MAVKALSQRQQKKKNLICAVSIHGKTKKQGKLIALYLRQKPF
jgi:hypothetical protein